MIASARKKEPLLVVTFRTTTDVLSLEAAAKEAGIPGRIIPVPGAVKAGCGLAFAAPPDTGEALRRFMTQKQIRWEGIHELLL